MKRPTIFFAVLLISLQMFSLPSYAETFEGGSLRRNIATVIFCGLGGAVLGLSTLSFYGDPQEHVNNITAGFIVGVLGGSIYVAADSTAKTSVANQEWPTNPHQVNLKVPSIWKVSWNF
jgi:hypothetical protein